MHGMGYQLNIGIGTDIIRGILKKNNKIISDENVFQVLLVLERNKDEIFTEIEGILLDNIENIITKCNEMKVVLK